MSRNPEKQESPTVIVRLHDAQRPSSGDIIRLTARKGHVHVFDTETQLRCL